MAGYPTPRSPHQQTTSPPISPKSQVLNRSPSPATSTRNSSLSWVGSALTCREAPPETNSPFTSVPREIKGCGVGRSAGVLIAVEARSRKHGYGGSTWIGWPGSARDGLRRNRVRCRWQRRASGGSSGGELLAPDVGFETSGMDQPVDRGCDHVDARFQQPYIVGAA